ncbi:zinc-dependent alcohol dehydrogenase family protein [Paraburkholderia sp. LEh10]|uniref:zinc-dependent alcohol dehydrogenase family protein n=1 Tax=Paraburkholderia sp. LEh10 TaxID=2821353 RepID=UPI001AE5C8C6|nr:zinc-dependent alcohol dehydrogenase family protein [Paraburkholderia sp. LEh10]MBP0589516.1 zinc-dependent alcohol dehydrogenase family protein [Paraburkholderia sp. LEh10]
MKVKAAVLNAAGAQPKYADSQPLTIETVDLQGPGVGEVLVKISAAGLCHSDLSVINGDRPRPLPMVLGHEASAVVVEVGSGVVDLQAGDHVVAVFVPSCGHCEPCAEGRPALCVPGATANTAGTLLSGGRRLQYRGEPINHHLGCSVFAEYATLSRRSLVKIDPDIPLDTAALFGCAVLTGMGAVINTAGFKAGMSIAVIGLGGVGMAALLGAISAGERQIVAVDLADSRLQFARSLGATHVYNARDPDTETAIREATSGGVDRALEFAGAIPALGLAYNVTRRGGVTVTAGLPPPTSTFGLSVAKLVGEERNLKGSYIGTCVPSRDIPRYMSMYMQGRLPVDRLLTGRLTLDNINHGFDLLHEGEAIRQIVTFI